MTSLADEGKSLSACETSNGDGFDFDQEAGDLFEDVVRRVYYGVGYDGELSLVGSSSDAGEEPVSDDPVRDSISLIFQELKELRALDAEREERAKAEAERAATRIGDLEYVVANQDELITQLVNFIYWRESLGVMYDFEELYNLSQYYKGHPDELEVRAKLVQRFEDGLKQMKRAKYDMALKAHVLGYKKDIEQMDEKARKQLFMGEWLPEGSSINLQARSPGAVFGRDGPITHDSVRRRDEKATRERGLEKLSRPDKPSEVTEARLNQIFLTLATKERNGAADPTLSFIVIKRELDLKDAAMTRLGKQIDRDPRFERCESSNPRPGSPVQLVRLSEEGRRQAMRHD
ncbi:MAG TPA: hypothetical protein PLX30_11050 [Methanothrix sp.]|nr:hypothetical protein [Methanothrix sp.]